MSGRKGVACDKCQKHFRDTSDLRKHKQRKTPCSPILDDADIPEEKKDKPRCKFCGRTFSTRSNLLNHMKKNCKIAPRNGDTSGMDILYEHVLKKQEETMRAVIGKMESLEAAVISGGAPRALVPCEEVKMGIVRNAIVQTNHGVVDLSTKTIKQNITINVFGSENTSHITQRDVLGLFRSLGPLGEDLSKAGERLILSMAMMIFSDEKHPENITCYLPSKKGKDALVHAQGGWEVMPVCLTLSPMAARSVDELFKKQPWPGIDGIAADVNLDAPTKILTYIKENEGTIIGNVSAPGSELRAIPIRNRDLLDRVLRKLPKTGDQ